MEAAALCRSGRAPRMCRASPQQEGPGDMRDKGEWSPYFITTSRVCTCAALTLALSNTVARQARSVIAVFS